MMTRPVPVAVGSAVALVVLGIGAQLTGQDPMSLVRGEGEGRATSAPQVDSRGRWDPPARPSDEELAAMSPEESMAAELALLDPRGEQEPGEPVQRQGDAELEFDLPELEGYPSRPPVSIPPGLQLKLGIDNSADQIGARGRQWMYAAPADMQPDQLCEESLAVLRAGGLVVPGQTDCQRSDTFEAGPGYVGYIKEIRAEGSDGTYVRVTLREDSITCAVVTYERQLCTQWSFYLLLP